jgi:hypothetical protein
VNTPNCARFCYKSCRPCCNGHGEGPSKSSFDDEDDNPFEPEEAPAS